MIKIGSQISETNNIFELKIAEMIPKIKNPRIICVFNDILKFFKNYLRILKKVAKMPQYKIIACIKEDLFIKLKKL